MRLLKEIYDLLGNYQLKSGVYHFYRNEFAAAVKFLRKALAEPGERSEADEPIVKEKYLGAKCRGILEVKTSQKSGREYMVITKLLKPRTV